jgi:hypothetical protein
MRPPFVAALRRLYLGAGWDAHRSRIGALVLAQLREFAINLQK